MTCTDKNCSVQSQVKRLKLLSHYRIEKSDEILFYNRMLKTYIFLLSEYKDIEDFMNDTNYSTQSEYVKPITSDESKTIEDLLLEIKYKLKCKCL